MNKIIEMSASADVYHVETPNILSFTPRGHPCGRSNERHIPMPVQQDDMKTVYSHRLLFFRWQI